MRVSLKWLQDYVDIVLSPDDLAHRMTMAGIEVAAIERTGATWDRDKILVGEITALAPHPNADRLQLATANYGRGVITVVTGAWNIHVGDRIPVALLGARLKNGHSEQHEEIVLKPTKLRGIPSEGMVCSELELGLGGDHAGIMISAGRCARRRCAGRLPGRYHLRAGNQGAMGLPLDAGCGTGSGRASESSGHARCNLPPACPRLRRGGRRHQSVDCGPH